MRFPTLTAFRGVAALVVIVYHARNFFGAPLEEWAKSVDAWFGQAFIAVDFFFVLSGFVISHAYLKRFNNAGKNESRAHLTKEFILFRFARMWPVHIFFLLIWLADQTAQHYWNPFAVPREAFKGEAYSIYSFVTNIFMVHAWGLHNSTSWNFPSWSVSSEWLAYLLFPITSWLVWKARHHATRILLSAVILGGLYLMKETNPVQTLGWFRFQGSWARVLASFLYGALLYRTYLAAPWQTKTRAQSSALLALLLAAWCATFVYGVDEIILLVCFGPVLLAAAHFDQSHQRIEKGPLVFLGSISLSTYLAHAILLRWWIWATWGTNGNLSMAQGLSALAAWLLVVHVIAAACHKYIEMPAQTRIRAWWKNLA
ncbi:MAG: acyltransferase [Planctomycetes bacterium]|jgi:peptidoglycan/LPS O-acetylase OafA/YrhL|nr:acyltransferase [Planctomycetota bacterium]MBT4029387.1 acyltransferase [Planctomycetota bacterium]MBT5120826.1 acyltransferase [Planctomycetota bacterium]